MDHDGSDPIAPTATETTRRRLLRAATSGFSLAASGLFLPKGFEQAVAREGATNGKLGGRHGKDHKGRHRRRTHGDKKEKGRENRAPGAGTRGNSIKYVALRAGGLLSAPQPPYTSVGDVGVQFYFRYQQNRGWSSLALGDAGGNIQNSHADYAPNRYFAAAYIDNASSVIELFFPIYVEIHNPLCCTPWVKVIGGCSIVNGEPVGGETFVADFFGGGASFAEGEQHDIPLYSLRKLRHILRVERFSDSATHKWFGATIMYA